MREKSFILTVLLTLFFGSQPKEVMASSKRAISGVTELSARLDGDVGATELFAIANEVGPFIDQIRKANPSPNSLKKMKALKMRLSNYTLKAWMNLNYIQMGFIGFFICCSIDFNGFPVDFKGFSMDFHGFLIDFN